jgi:hypothetical protein
LHPNKQKYKSEKETLYFYYKKFKKKQKTHKNIKVKSLKKKLKHEPNIVEITQLCIRHGVQTSHVGS